MGKEQMNKRLIYLMHNICGDREKISIVIILKLSTFNIHYFISVK